MGANFERLQSLLGARAGTDVRLISVSIDPLTDTPQRLGGPHGGPFVAAQRDEMADAAVPVLREHVADALRAAGGYAPTADVAAAGAQIVVGGLDFVASGAGAHLYKPRMIAARSSAGSPSGIAGIG